MRRVSVRLMASPITRLMRTLTLLTSATFANVPLKMQGKIHPQEGGIPGSIR